MQKVIGIYVGLFDPVHAGHLAFALQAIEQSSLETVYFLPERMPIYRRPVEHYGHRVAMLGRALQPHQQLELLETSDKRFVPVQTIPRLQAALHTGRFVFLCSAQSFIRFCEDSENIVKSQHFIVSIQDKQELQAVNICMELQAISPSAITLVDALRPDIASEYVRLALSRSRHAPGLLPSVAAYARSEWLYARLPHSQRVG